jgi:alkylation response protein AidB-like acyl-CoA dehydrogenase
VGKQRGQLLPAPRLAILTPHPMDFDLTDTERAFAEEVRRFLRANPPEAFPIDGMDAGYGSGANSRAFMKALGAQGWLDMCWPKAYGGREQPMFMKLVLMEELALSGAPFGPLAGVWQTADAIIEFGTERLRRDLLPAIARGEATFWQGYSEPDAGSDLLALKTEARRDGDHYVIRGHKIWSSHAGVATHGLVFTRTSRETRRSRGFSMFVVPNGTPGMDIRPIRSLTGEVYHHEVFLDDVRVPADLMLGPLGEGFQALLNGLDADRFWGRFYKAPALERVLRQLVAYANATHVRGVPLARDPGLRRRLAAIAADITALRLIFYRTGCLIRDGAPLTYETAMAKVYADETGQKLARLGMDLLGVWGPLREGSRWAKLGGQISHLYLTTLGHTIAGGTAEILRTSVAVRGLGLPPEPKVAAEPRR